MAWTDPRTWVTDELVTAAMMNAHLRDNLNAVWGPILAFKSADESVASSIAPQDDNHLFHPLGANEVWFLSLHLWLLDNGGSAHFRPGCSMPAGGESNFGGIYWIPGTPSSISTIQFTEATSSSVHFITPSDGQVVEYHGFAQTDVTAGNWQFQWAQGTSSGSTVVVKKGSFLTGWQIT